MEITTIHKRMKEMETFKEQNKVAREALRNELENNNEYLAVCEEVKAVLDKRKRIRDAIWAKTETQKLVSDIKENKEELSTLEEILSSELVDYYKEKDTDEITDADGDPRRFKIMVKLLPKNKYAERDGEGKYSAQIDPNLHKANLDETSGAIT